jgi:eukaryotic-like serine/threonine-protein kinase
MSLEPGRRLGPYEIVAPIGAGGMGEVYRALDRRLERSVAIKILPAALSSDAQLRLRLEREAKVISSLSHPHICTLFDVGSDDGVDYLVMEHLEGETLEARIARGALPIDEVFRFSLQIADALDKAHRRGVIHRDLKPSNVMITRSGAKLLDFGLARPSDGGPVPLASILTGETVQRPITAEGSIIGTFQYMAPEQIEGRPVDSRSDIFAFGALLYEMITGKRAFDGRSRASVVAAVLASEPPPVSQVRPVTPHALDRLVRLCLEKDPDERWQSAHDLRLELERIRDLPRGEPAGGAKPSWRRIAPWIAASALVVAASSAAFVGYRTANRPDVDLEFEIPPPEAKAFSFEDIPANISPDGTATVARFAPFSSTEPLWLRRLDSVTMVPIPGSEGAYDVFWSPDGKEIAFATDGQELKKVSVNGGPPTTLSRVGDFRGGAWLSDGTIVAASEATGPIVAIAAGGGTPVAVTKLDESRRETGHWRPAPLPGRRFLYVAMSSSRDAGGVYAASLDSPEVKRVLDLPVPTVYAEPGWLIYQHEGALFAQKFDARRLQTSGAPVRVSESVSYISRWGQPGYAASNNGVLVYHPGGGTSQTEIVRFSREAGSAESLGIEGMNIDLSRDGTRLAVMRLDPKSGVPDIWVHDLVRGVSSRLTWSEMADVGPVWSPDSTRIVYVGREESGVTVKIRLANGAGEEERVFSHPSAFEVVDWSRDGRYLLCEVFGPSDGVDLAVIDLESPDRLIPVIATRFREFSARFSRDGKWIAYVSNESGENEIYVQSFPPDGRKVKISNGGGDAPRWRGDGAELYYISRNRTLLGVELRGGNPLDPATPRPLLDAASLDIDAAAAGDVFYAARIRAIAATPIVIRTGWQRRLGAR